MGKENVGAHTQGQGCSARVSGALEKLSIEICRHTTAALSKGGKGEGNGPVSSFVQLSRALVYASRYIMWNKSDCGVPVAFSRFFIVGERCESTNDEYIMETVKEKSLFSRGWQMMCEKDVKWEKSRWPIYSV